MTQTRWIIFVLICVVTLGGLVLLTKKDSVSVDTMDPSKAVSETTTALGDNIYGNKASKVVLIEYGDFQCPGCAGAYPQLKTIKETYKDQIAFIFRSFPLTTIHPNALASSTAAEAAGLQGKFWEMHDALYANQSFWSSIDASKRTDTFVDYARTIGLDTEKFKTDLSDQRISAKISRDRALGGKQNVSSTPTLILNNEKLSEDEVSDLIRSSGDKVMDKLDSALKAADIEPPKR